MRINTGHFLAKVINRICFIKDETYYYRKTIGSITNRVNIEKETFAFRTLITDFCANIDNIEIGAQKELFLFASECNKFSLL